MPQKGRPMLDTLETILVDRPVVGCDGGGGPLGHPLVYLKLGSNGEAVCPYCSRRFILDPDARRADAH
jgi:uncharacterized Zn-finger protein